MRRASLLTTLALAVVAHAQLKMSVTINGSPAGSGSLWQKIESNGELHQKTTVSLSVGKFTLALTSDVREDRNGRPIVDTSTEVVNGSAKMERYVYGAKAVTITVTENGKTTSTVVPIPNSNVSDASAGWFITSRPKPGAKASYVSYDLKTKKWEPKTTTYLGDEIVPGTKIKGHHIRHATEGDMWVDDKGYPYRMVLHESGAEFVIVRK